MKTLWKVYFVCLLLFAFLIPALGQDIEERVKTLEMLVKEPPEYIRSYEGDKIKIGGKLEFEFVKTQDDEDFPATTPAGHFQVDKVRLRAQVKPRDDIEFKFKLDFGIEQVEIDEAYLTFGEIPPFDQEISLGLQDRFISVSIERWTEGSPLARTAFWRYPDLGIQYKGKYQSVYWRASLTNGLVLSMKDIGEDKTMTKTEAGRDTIIRDDTEEEDPNGNKQVGVGLGYAPNLGDFGFLDVLGFGYFSKLSDDDLDFVNDLPDAPADNTDRTQGRYGANLAYTKDALEVYGQYVKAEDSFLLRHSWFVQASYKLDLALRYLKAIQPLIRYGEYRTNRTPEEDKPLTWDRKTTTVALLNHIEERVIVKLEYAINDEETGGEKPDNNEFLAQLEYKF